MKQVTHTKAFLRKRKMLLVLPLLGLPFITLAFWALGGGRTDRDSSAESSQGLNLQLPSAQLKEDSTLTKLSFYERAQSDSQKRREWMRSDPYYRDLDTTLLWSSERQLEPSPVATTSYKGYDPGPLKSTPYDTGVESTEEKVMQKLSQLNQAIQHGEEDNSKKEKTNTKTTISVDPNFSEDINRLEAMMQHAGNNDEGDPELKQLSTMMDKILDIQHPERVKERIKEASLVQKEAVYPVQAEGPTMSISLLGSDTVKKGFLETSSKFLGLEDNQQQNGKQTSVLATIHGTQTLNSGSVVKMSLEQNIYVGGELIPKGSFIYGIAEMNRERLQISITSIRSGVAILPVKLRVFDLDGIEGVYMPGSLQREVAKSSTDHALQGLELSAIDPTFKAQAASAGISAAKNLLSRKVKVEKVTLKGGYQVILQSM